MPRRPQHNAPASAIGKDPAARDERALADPKAFLPAGNRSIDARLRAATVIVAFFLVSLVWDGFGSLWPQKCCKICDSGVSPRYVWPERAQQGGTPVQLVAGTADDADQTRQHPNNKEIE